MIVQCASCRTRFRVDDSRIPGRGARMRCRRCGEAIIVMKEEGERPAAPAPRQNLFDLRSVLKRPEERPPGFPEPPPPAEVPTVSPPADGISEGELGAAEAGPADLRTDAGQEAPPARPEETPPDAAPLDEVGGPYLRETEPPSGEPRAAAQVEVPPAAPEETLRDAVQPDEAHPADDAPPAPEPSFPPEDAEKEPRKREEREIGGEEPEVSPMFAAGRGAPEEKDRTFELVLEDTELLDFLKQDNERGEFDISRNLRPHPSPGEEAPPPRAVDETSAEEARSERLEAIQRELEEIGGGAPAEEEAPPAATREPVAAPPAPPKPYPPLARPGPGRAVRPAVVTLLALFLLIAGGGAYLGFTGSGQRILRSLIPGMESLWLGGGDTGPRYAVGNLIGYYEANARAGRMFVIKGAVTNQGRNIRGGVRIHAGILDGNGRTLAEMAAYAGNILSGEALRRSSRQTIEKEMANRWGDALMNLDIPPGKSVPFMVVFFDAPEGIEEYRLDARDVE